MENRGLFTFGGRGGGVSMILPPKIWNMSYFFPSFVSISSPLFTAFPISVGGGWETLAQKNIIASPLNTPLTVKVHE